MAYFIVLTSKLGFCMHGARYGRTIIMCALALVAVGAFAVSGISGVNSREISPRVFSIPSIDENTPAEMLKEVQAIERAAGHAFDNLNSDMDTKEVMLAVSQTLKPNGNFSGTYEVVICQVSAKEQDGDLVVNLKVTYELRDDDSVLRRELSRSGTLSRGRTGGPKNV